MENEKKREVFNYVLKVRGLFGRNRKIKFDTYNLAKHVDRAAPKALDELMPLMRAKLVEIKFKGGEVWLDEDPVTLETHDMGDRVYTTESYMLMSGRTLHKEQVEGGGVTFSKGA